MPCYGPGWVLSEGTISDPVNQSGLSEQYFTNWSPGTLDCNEEALYLDVIPVITSRFWAWFQYAQKQIKVFEPPMIIHTRLTHLPPCGRLYVVDMKYTPLSWSSYITRPSRP